MKSKQAFIRLIEHLEEFAEDNEKWAKIFVTPVKEETQGMAKAYRRAAKWLKELVFDEEDARK